MNSDFPIRKIIHIDMDAFYASVEQLDNPELRGKPVAVGGGRERGVVAAASYEARKYGVRSAMPGQKARKLCPHIIFIKPRFERYKEISQQIREIFFKYTDLVEPLSLDEAFLDVTENTINCPSATLIATKIREEIKEKTGLNATEGISVNKITAKKASDINKPNGQKTIPPENLIQFLDELPIEKFFGVGKATAKKMHALGIFTGRDLKQLDLAVLSHKFGKQGLHFFNIVRGIQHSEVKPNRIRKSIAAETTFTEDLSSETQLLERFDRIADELERRMERNKVKGKTITIKLKYSDFTIHTRSKTLTQFVGEKNDFFSVVESLLSQSPVEKPVRLLGISISNLDNQQEMESVNVQLEFDF